LFWDLVPAIDKGIYPMGALEHFTPPIGPNECSNIRTFQDNVLPSDEAPLEAMIGFDIPLDVYVLQSNLFKVESIFDLLFKSNLSICRSLDFDISLWTLSKIYKSDYAQSLIPLAIDP
jgi:hypothetical protein